MEEYFAALDEFRAASRVFTTVQEDYRARRIGDAEFLAAREVYLAASQRVDDAEAAIQS